MFLTFYRFGILLPRPDADPAGCAAKFGLPLVAAFAPLLMLFWLVCVRVGWRRRKTAPA
jgi:hypothetical protein